MKTLHVIVMTLVIIGALNWGLIGLFQYNLVESLLGGLGLTNIVYILVGISAVYLIFTHKGDCKICGAK